jgi:SOS response associated peptidase (SRAP)
MLPIIRTYKPDRIELARWGFRPEEWKRSTRVRPQINARLETAAEKPMFASSFRGRHCLAPYHHRLITVPIGTNAEQLGGPQVGPVERAYRQWVRI